MNWTALLCVAVAVVLLYVGAALWGFIRGLRAPRPFTIPGQVSVRPVRWRVIGAVDGEPTTRHVFASSEQEAIMLAEDFGIDSIESVSITPA